MPVSMNESKTVRNPIINADRPALRRDIEAFPLARDLSINFKEFEAGRATARLQGTTQLPNFFCYSHVGALFTLAEQIMAEAANSLGL